MGKIIAVANQKGGVGKTTTCVNLCAALAKRNRKVLLADCDPQGNSTSGMGVSKDKMPNVYDLLLRGAPASDCIVKTNFGDEQPSNKELSGASVELVRTAHRKRPCCSGISADTGPVRVLCAGGDSRPYDHNKIDKKAA